MRKCSTTVLDTLQKSATAGASASARCNSLPATHPALSFNCSKPLQHSRHEKSRACQQLLGTKCTQSMQLHRFIPKYRERPAHALRAAAGTPPAAESSTKTNSYAPPTPAHSDNTASIVCSNVCMLRLPRMLRPSLHCMKASVLPPNKPPAVALQYCIPVSSATCASRATACCCSANSCMPGKHHPRLAYGSCAICKVSHYGSPVVSMQPSAMNRPSAAAAA